MISPKAEWPRLMTQLRAAVPEAFNSSGHVLNLYEGTWTNAGKGREYYSPVDGTHLGRLPMLDLETGLRAVRFAKGEFHNWAATSLDERRRRVSACLAALRKHRDLIATLLMWEIGKPFAQAATDVDRGVSGVEWYVDNIEPMMQRRKPLGLVSNVASWNYPLSVLMHSVLAQLLAGNSVIAKVPTDGALFALGLSMALARRAGLPVSLVSGSGAELNPALVRSADVDCLAYVGGKANGRVISAGLDEHSKRYLLEMEGVNGYGVWNFSDWGALATQLKKGFDYGKQRCTAYVRYVVQRELFPRFLDMYIPVLKSLKFGNPMLVANADDPLPALDFGPLINKAKVDELRALYRDALDRGAVALYEGEPNSDAFLPGQDTSAYMAPVALLDVPRSSRLYHNEPFGPIDTLAIVDTVEELIAEMNVSNGCLVASIACDDAVTAKAIAGQLRSFKVGINAMRSRGDREEFFGGLGESWKGYFTGGSLLIEAVTVGPPGEKAYGNFAHELALPERT